MENIDVKYAEQKNILCISSPEGNSNAVAEHTMGMLLMWQHNIRKANDEVRNNIWLRKENTGYELKDKTIGIIGYGNVGMALANKAVALGMKVLAYDKYKTNFSTNEIVESSLDEIKQQASIISFNVPLTNETKHLANEHFFATIKQPVLLVNTSRGEVINTAALITALQQKKIKGACLDVLENEKIDELNDQEKKYFEYLKNNANVILTPHIAGWTHEAKYNMAALLIERLKKNFIIN